MSVKPTAVRIGVTTSDYLDANPETLIYCWQVPTVKTYTVSVVCQGITLSSEVLERLFTALGDVVPAERDNAITITAQVEDRPDDLSAAIFLVEAIMDALPEASILRLDQDLVSVSDIAARTRRSRESVRLLIDGKRGPGSFPPSVGTVGDGIRVWPWASVLIWFRDRLGDGLDEEGVSQESAAMVDGSLALARASMAGDVGAFRRDLWGFIEAAIRQKAEAPARAGHGGTVGTIAVAEPAAGSRARSTRG